MSINVRSLVFSIALVITVTIVHGEENTPDGYRSLPWKQEVPCKPTAEHVKWGFIPFSRNPFMHVYAESAPLKNEVANEITLSAARDEYEPVTLSLYPLKDSDFAVSISDLSGPNGSQIAAKSIDVRVVIPVALRVRKENGIKLVKWFPKRLERIQRISLKAKKTQTIWLTIHVPKNARGGKYKGVLKLDSNSGTIVNLPINVTVYDFVLQPTHGIEYMMRMDQALSRAWGGGDKKRNKLVLRSARKIYQDMKNHGMTACSPRMDAKLGVSDDGTFNLFGLIASLRLAKETGLIGPCIWDFEQLINAGKPGKDGPFTSFRPKIDMANLEKIVKQVNAITEAEGLPQVVFCPINEPEEEEKQEHKGLTRCDLAVTLLKVVKKAGGRTGCALVQEMFFRSPNKLEPIKPLLDIWIVDRNAVSSVTIADCKKHGGEFRMYHNGTTMYDDPERSRFPYGFYAWATGIRGMGGWTYPCYPNITNIDAWEKDKNTFPKSFFESSWEPTPTIAWEAIREGIDDIRYIQTLEKYLCLAPDMSDSNCRGAKQLLEKLRKEISHTYKDYNVELGVKPRWTVDKMAEVRAELAKYTERIISKMGM